MIKKVQGWYEMVCDHCGEVADEVFCDFEEAAVYALHSRWRSERVGTSWENICPNCQVNEDFDR